MLQAIRDKAKGWVAWVIVVLITIPFALFGIQEYLGADADPAVVSVNGNEIKKSQLEQRTTEFRNNMRNLLGDNYRAEIFENSQMQVRMLDRLVDESVQRQATLALNMQISDNQTRQYIQAIPSFQTDGKFDKKIYNATVRNRGMSSSGFEVAIRDEIISTQFRKGISNSAFITDAALKDQIALSEQIRDISYFSVMANSYHDASSVTDEQINTFYKDNQASYKVPERVKVSYLLLDAAELAKTIEVTDEALQIYFEENEASFIADEEREMRHILISNDSGDDATSKKLADSVRAKLIAGGDFAELAKQYSKDSGSAENAGQLGWVSKGLMVGAFEDAAFSLTKDSLSEPIKTDFGYHLIEVTNIRGASNKRFEDFRVKVEQEYRRKQAEDQYFSLLEQFADAAYETPDSLEPAAEIIDQKLIVSDWMSRTAPLVGALSSEKIVNAAFSDDVLQQANNSAQIDLGATKAVILRIHTHELETIKPLERVIDDVRMAATATFASEAAALAGKDFLVKIKAGADFKTVATEANLTIIDEIAISRLSNNIAAEVIASAFSVKSPAKGSQSYTGVVSAEGDYFVIVSSNVVNGDLAKFSDEKRQAKLTEIQGAASENEFTKVTSLLRQKAAVEFTP